MKIDYGIQESTRFQLELMSDEDTRKLELAYHSVEVDCNGWEVTEANRQYSKRRKPSKMDRFKDRLRVIENRVIEWVSDVLIVTAVVLIILIVLSIPPSCCIACLPSWVMSQANNG